MSKFNESAEIQEISIDCVGSPLQTTSETTNTDLKVVDNDTCNSIEVNDSSSLSTLSKESLPVHPLPESTCAVLSELESCVTSRAEEKNGKGGKEISVQDDNEETDGKSLKQDNLTIAVSEVVTAFQEVKSELKNAVIDAHCEFVSTVSEVRNELSHGLFGGNPLSDQSIEASALTDTEGNVIFSDAINPSESVSSFEPMKSDGENLENFSSNLDQLTLGEKPQCKILCDDLLEDDDNMQSKPEFLFCSVPSSKQEKSSTDVSQTSETDENMSSVESHIQNNNVFMDVDIVRDFGQGEEDASQLSIGSEEVRAQPTSAPSTPVPTGPGSVRRVMRAHGCQGRRVSFPEDDTRLISSYLEPVNPWQKMKGVTVEEIAAAYRSSCERHNTQPLPGVLQQIRALPLVVGGRVECISLRGQRLEGGQCEGLEEIFRRVQFKVLDLEGCSLEDDTAIPLFDMIEFYDSATQLNISCNSRIGFRGWQACARMLKRTPSVEYLDARNTNLNETNMPILGRALRLGARLHTLHLENCNLTGRPLIMLTAALKQNDTLAELYLAENRLGVNDCIQLSNLVRANSTLRVLDLRNNNVQDAGCGHVCEGVCEQQKIQHEKESNEAGPDNKKVIKGLNFLILWNNHLTQQSASHLACLLAGSTTLEMLNLGRNNLTSEGILRLKESLLRNRSLLRLGLQAARIADEGAVALAEYTADNTVIQQIDLRENPIKVAGLMALAHSLRVNNTITQLDLDSDPRTEPAVELAEQHLALQKEIKEYCQRNLTRTHLHGSCENGNKDSEAQYTIATHSKLSVNSVARKVSLTCETSSRSFHYDSRNDVPIREEEKQKYISPAPSPLPSPAPSPCASPSPSPVPSPSKNRFRVFKVQEASRSTSQLPLNAVHTPVVCSSAPVSQRSMSAGDLNLPSKQPSARPNRFSIGGRFTVTRVTEMATSCSLPSSQSTSTSSVLTSSGALSSPKIVISSPVRVERGFSIEEAAMCRQNGEDKETMVANCSRGTYEGLPEGQPKIQTNYKMGHVVRLKSDSDSDDVFVDATNASWSEGASQRGSSLRSNGNENSNGAEKDNDSVSSSELTDSGFLDDSVCSRMAVGSNSPSPSSPHSEHDRDSLLSSSVDSTSQEDAGLGSSNNSSTSSSSQISPLPVSVQLPPSPAAQSTALSAPPEPLKRAPLAAMENGSFDSDSEDSEVTTQSSDSTHSDEVRITTEQFAPRPAWGTKQEEMRLATEALHTPKTPSNG